MSTNKIQNVALIGATGQMGSHIVNELTKNSQFHITALTRKGGKSAGEMQKGIQAVKEVDYDQHESIVEALKGQDVLIVTLSTAAPQDLPNKLVDAAHAAGVKWYIPNAWGYDLSHNKTAEQEHLHSRFVKAHTDYVEHKGLAYSTVCCGYWYEWSISGGLNMFGIDANEKKANFYNQGQIPITVSTWSQTARILAAFLALPIESKDSKELTMQHWRNKPIHVNSFYLTQRQMLDEVEKVTQTKDSEWQIEDVDGQKLFKESFEKFFKGDGSAFVTAIYSRIFLSDKPGDVLQQCQTDMNLLGVKADENLQQCTEKAIEMQKSNYIKTFFANRR